MSKQQRQKILNVLSISCAFGEGWVSAAEIDKNGLAKALRLGVRRALNHLSVAVQEEIIIDGKVNYLPAKFRAGKCLVDADNLVPIVSAASIYAKVARDGYMSGLAKRYPAYGFERHVGYGTKDHQQALESLGFIKRVHRLSYSPIARMAKTI
jgi:ribonuclease HII